jgi:hypothetical protein
LASLRLFWRIDVSWWTWTDVTGALVRRVSAEVINVSSRGCLLETCAPIKPGTVGLLEVDGGENGHSEVVRVCHAVERAGASVPFRVGTEFLVLDAAASPSVRQKVARLEALHMTFPPKRATRRAEAATEKTEVGQTTAEEVGQAYRRRRRAEVRGDGEL